MTKLFLSFLFIFVLAACGSESDSNSNSNNNNGGGNSGSDIVYVTGEMKTSTSTDDLYAPAHDAAYGNLGYACSVNNDFYFESANVVVFGSTGYPDNDFKYAATLVENNLDNALTAMGVTKAEFDNARPIFIASAVNSIIDFMSSDWDINFVEYDITDLTLTTPFEAPVGWAGLIFSKRIKHLRSYWNNLDAGEQFVFSLEFKDTYQLAYPSNTFNPMGEGVLRIPKKIMVCLTDMMDSSVYGEGTILGMNLPPRSYATRSNSDESQVVLHELIHAIQQNIAAPVRTVGRTMDHWFTEGQATFLAGQTAATATDGKNPVDVVTWADETSVFASTGDAYKHYALAYSYIDKNNSANQIKAMLYNIRSFKGEGEISPSNFISGAAFESAFNKNMTKKGGETLSLQEFRSDYQSLMNQ